MSDDDQLDELRKKVSLLERIVGYQILTQMSLWSVVEFLANKQEENAYLHSDIEDIKKFTDEAVELYQGKRE